MSVLETAWLIAETESANRDLSIVIFVKDVICMRVCGEALIVNVAHVRGKCLRKWLFSIVIVVTSATSMKDCGNCS